MENKAEKSKEWDSFKGCHKEHVLCLVGVEKFFVEKDLIKFLRKHLESDRQTIPLHSVHKKRNQAFGFLNFKDEDQMKEFTALFTEQLPEKVMKKLRLNPCNNSKKVDGKQFKLVKSADEYQEQTIQRI